MRRLLSGGMVAAVLAGCVTAPPSAAPAPAEGSGASEAAFPTTPPALGPAPTLTLPRPVRRTLPNGLEVLYVPRTGLPIVHATLVTRGGEADAPARSPELPDFTAEMLDEGAGGKDALELAAAIEQLGASLDTGAGWDAVQVDLEVLRERLPRALALMADVVIRPDFPTADLQRVREERLTDLARAKDEPRIIAGNAFASLVYGSDNPYGRLPTTAATRAIDRAAMVEFHRKFYRPASSTLVLVGDVDPAVVQPVVEQAFGGWQRGRAAEPVRPGVPELGETTVYLVDKPGAAQSEIRIGHPGVSRDDPDYFPLTVLNTLLGGSFTSRLNMNLREVHGYTYGARSAFDMRRGVGPFVASSAVTTAKTDSALIEFFRELERIRDEPVPQDELERAKQYVALGLPRRFETTGATADQLATLAVHGLDPGFFESYVQRIGQVTAADVQRVAREYVRPGRSVVVVVGDRQSIEPGIRALDIGAVQVRPAEEFVR